MALTSISVDLLSIVCRLATTNAPATEHDAAFIREAIDKLSEESVELRLQLQTIDNRLHEIERNLKYLKPMVSPLRRMPVELLSHIFGYVLGGPRIDQSALVKLCQVCKGWRDTAHSVPSLWKSVIVDVSKPSLSSKAVHSWIIRSVNLPKTIVITSNECGKSAPSQTGFTSRYRCAGGNKCLFSKSLLSDLFKGGPTINTVSIQCPTPSCFQNLADCLMLSFPDSKQSTTSFELALDWTDCDWANIPAWRFHFLPSSIRSLELHLPSYYGLSATAINNLQIDIPRSVLKPLTSLVLTCDWPGQHVLKILKLCPGLETLNMALGRGAFSQYAEGSSVIQAVSQPNGLVLPKLKEIRLEEACIESLPGLAWLVMPALSDLAVSLGPEDWMPNDGESDNIMTTATGESFGRLLRGDPKVPSALRSLHITNGLFEDDNTLPKAFQDLLCLEDLTLENVLFSRGVFATVASRGLLPSLQSLELLKIHVEPGELTGLDDFVKRRGICLEVTRCPPHCSCSDEVI